MAESKSYQGQSDSSTNQLCRSSDPEKAVGAPTNTDNELWPAENDPGLSSEQEAGSVCDDDDDDPDETYPEGGLTAWLVVLGSWMILFSALGVMNTLAVFQTYVTTHQLSEYSAGTVGWIFSIYTFLSFFLGIYVGPLFDKYGPRWLVFFGTICLVAGLMLLSICTEYWHFILDFGLLCGMASSFLFTPSIAAVGHFFSKRRGLATGLASTGGSVGGIVFPLMLQRLFDQVGWGWSIRIFAFLCLVLCGTGNILIRSRLPPAKNASAHPDFRIFRNRPFLFCTIAVFVLELALFIPLTYISSYARREGFSEAFSYQILPLLNAGSAVGRALPGYWCDRIGPFNANMITSVLCAITCLAIWLPAGSTTPGLIIFALSFGFASGGNICLTPVCVGRLCRTQEYGRYYATCYTIVAVACLIGIPIGGNILSATNGNYWSLILFTGVTYAVSVCFFFAAKVSRVGWRMKAKY
ncbi:Riboflavin transporter mch5 [Pleurostoma richardsiae]|uniref:Riboflavin transporter mch5 n=1 Tax=Pleurostoma richardsiae TaxID=41990 RepID=A0AA38S363_9PEZI|nr:Riboflavin transporter mch5 [Pleurostoma richardsiae]